MFEYDPKLKILEVTPSAVVEIHHSLNTAEVATRDFVGETARAYICIIALASGRRALFVNFFYPNKNQAIFYPYSNNPFAADRMEEVKEEAMLFLESFGLIMEQVVGEKSAAKDKEYWMNRVPFFKTGIPAGEIILRAPSLAFPADGAGQLVISSDIVRDAKGEMVANGARIKAGTNAGVLVTIDGGTEGQQLVVPTMEGMISFVLRAPDKPEKAVVTAASEEGSARGEIIVEFVPLDPAGEIKLTATPPQPPADGKTRVNLKSEPVGDSLGNIVADGTPFVIEISDQERVHSSLHVTSQKGIINHTLVAPVAPVTMLISVKSQKGEAKGELVITFEVPLPVIEEKPAPPPRRPDKTPLPFRPVETKIEPQVLEPAEKESFPAFMPSKITPPFLDESKEKLVFQQEEKVSVLEETVDKATKAPAAAPPEIIKETSEKISLSSLPPLAEEVIPPAKAPEPARGTKSQPPSEKPAPREKVPPQWEPYQDLIRFLTHM